MLFASTPNIIVDNVDDNESDSSPNKTFVFPETKDNFYSNVFDNLSDILRPESITASSNPLNDSIHTEDDTHDQNKQSLIVSENKEHEQRNDDSIPPNVESLDRVSKDRNGNHETNANFAVNLDEAAARTQPFKELCLKMKAKKNSNIFRNDTEDEIDVTGDCEINLRSQSDVTDDDSYLSSSIGPYLSSSASSQSDNVSNDLNVPSCLKDTYLHKQFKRPFKHLHYKLDNVCNCLNVPPFDERLLNVAAPEIRVIFSSDGSPLKIYKEQALASKNDEENLSLEEPQPSGDQETFIKEVASHDKHNNPLAVEKATAENSSDKCLSSSDLNFVHDESAFVASKDDESTESLETKAATVQAETSPFPVFEVRAKTINDNDSLSSDINDDVSKSRMIVHDERYITKRAKNQGNITPLSIQEVIGTSEDADDEYSSVSDLKVDTSKSILVVHEKTFCIKNGSTETFKTEEDTKYCEANPSPLKEVTGTSDDASDKYLSASTSNDTNDNSMQVDDEKPDCSELSNIEVANRHKTNALPVQEVTSENSDDKLSLDLKEDISKPIMIVYEKTVSIESEDNNKSIVGFKSNESTYLCKTNSFPVQKVSDTFEDGDNNCSSTSDLKINTSKSIMMVHEKTVCAETREDKELTKDSKVEETSVESHENEECTNDTKVSSQSSHLNDTLECLFEDISNCKKNIKPEITAVNMKTQQHKNEEGTGKNASTSEDNNKTFTKSYSNLDAKITTNIDVQKQEKNSDNHDSKEEASLDSIVSEDSKLVCRTSNNNISIQSNDRSSDLAHSVDTSILSKALHISSESTFTDSDVKCTEDAMSSYCSSEMKENVTIDSINYVIASEGCVVSTPLVSSSKTIDTNNPVTSNARNPNFLNPGGTVLQSKKASDSSYTDSDVKCTDDAITSYCSSDLQTNEKSSDSKKFIEPKDALLKCETNDSNISEKTVSDSDGTFNLQQKLSDSTYTATDTMISYSSSHSSLKSHESEVAIKLKNCFVKLPLLKITTINSSIDNTSKTADNETDSMDDPVFFSDDPIVTYSPSKNETCLSQQMKTSSTLVHPDSSSYQNVASDCEVPAPKCTEDDLNSSAFQENSVSVDSTINIVKHSIIDDSDNQNMYKIHLPTKHEQSKNEDEIELDATFTEVDDNINSLLDNRIETGGEKEASASNNSNAEISSLEPKILPNRMPSVLKILSDSVNSSFTDFEGFNENEVSPSNKSEMNVLESKQISSSSESLLKSPSIKLEKLKLDPMEDLKDVQETNIII